MTDGIPLLLYGYYKGYSNYYYDTKADISSDPHLDGQTHILANQSAFSCSKFALALIE